MNNGKFAKRKGIATKMMFMILAVVLIVGISVGGTLAWLTDTTESVTNTFTVGDIDITLSETFNTDSDNDGKSDCWTAQMIPGYSYKKDPTVTVSDDSVDCYLFVKFDETGNAATYLDYTSMLTEANGWKQGDGTIPESVWYREVMSTDDTRSWKLLADDTVTVSGTAVTKANMETAAQASLTYTAYASQLYKSNSTADNKFTAAEAWANVSNPAGSTNP